MPRRRWDILVFLALFTILFARFVLPQTAMGGDLGKFLILILLLAVYLTGLFAVFFGSLSYLAPLYEALLVTLARIHYFVFGKIVNEGIKKTRYYKQTRAMIVHSGLFLFTTKILHKQVAKKTKDLHGVEMVECPKCEKEIPNVGKYCPFCKVSIEKKKV
jgi:hypothetical protein